MLKFKYPPPVKRRLNIQNLQNKHEGVH